MKAISRYIALRELPVAFVFTMLALLFKSSKPFYRPFDKLMDFQPFLIGLIVGSVVACLVGLIFGRQLAARQRLWAMLSLLAALIGLGCSPLLWLSIPRFLSLPISLLASTLLGFGLISALINYCVLLAQQPTSKNMLTLALALLVSALLWTCFYETTSLFASFSQMAGLCLIGVTPLLAHRVARSPAEQTSHPVSTTASDIGTAADCFRYGWAAVLALAYNTFSVGLTFWITGDEILFGNIAIHKLIIYVCIFCCILIVALSRLNIERPAMFILFRFALLGGAALILGGMYMVDFLGSWGIDILSGVPYYGTAVFYFIGFSVLLWVAGHLAANPGRLISLALLSTVLTLFAGLLVHLMLGDTFRSASNAFLAIFAIPLILSAAREVYRQLSGGQTVIGQAHEHSVKQDMRIRAVNCASFAEHYSLSPRETEIIALLAQGYSAKYISSKLCLSYETVRTHIKRIYGKVGAHSSDDLLTCIQRFSESAEQPQLASN
ncbi:MAG: helix-turn-helix transcriptional regulator [Coriobacteriales bacterium]|jgi:DNA-binding CsgD family transcriptional regulator|nr:helix-turn-helix transcriptional regulator [Coriobacteriales bacterium]